MKGFTGYPGNLSPEQDKTFSLFKQYVHEKVTTDPYFDDHYLCRFCRARDFDLTKVIKMWDDFWKWRAEIDIANIHKFKLQNIEQIKEMYPVGYYYTDKEGRPIYIERTGLVNPKKLLELTTEKDLIKHFVQSYEKMLNIVFPACSRVSGRRIDRTLTIIDLKGLSLTKVGKQIYNMMQMTSAIAQNYYPEVLGTMFVVNAPFLFSGLWSVIKNFIDEKTKKKIKILGSSYEKELKEYVDISKLPTFLGGKSTIPLSENPGPWKEEFDKYGSQMEEAPKETPKKEEEKENGENNAEVNFNIALGNENDNDDSPTGQNFQTPLNTQTNDDEQQAEQRHTKHQDRS